MKGVPLCNTRPSRSGRALGGAAEAWREKASPNRHPGAAMAVLGPCVPWPPDLMPPLSDHLLFEVLGRSCHQQQGC